ncbi:MAG TPA: flagellar motor switch protein FliN [Solirubrobacteraceae bacterium]|jgi:flagellar motor switch protein FliN/FliY|nr:flagellar motor switch protein FliN [Solirubrobacteraceae bacterium]
MTEPQHDLDYEQLEPTDGASADHVDLAPVADVTVELVVEIGRRRMTIGEALDLVPGAVVPLGRPSDEPVDIVVNGLRIARGEVVVVDEEFGVRLTEVTGRRPGATSGDDV